MQKHWLEFTQKNIKMHLKRNKIIKWTIAYEMLMMTKYDNKQNRQEISN